MPHVKSSVAAVVLALGCVAAAPAVAEEKFPRKTIRLLVPLSAGSAIDVLARWVGEKMTDSWGQQVLIDNRPSAGGTIASEYVLASNADGHTMMMVSTGHAGNATLYSKLSYNVIKDFAGVSQVASSPNVLVVTPTLGVKSVKDLITLAKQKPGQLNFSSAGLGSGSLINGEMFKLAAGINVVMVPYKGAPEALNNVIAGNVQYFFSPVMVANPHIKSGRVTPLAVSTAVRCPLFPEVPTVAEAGVSGFDYDQWYGLVVSAKTPRSLVTTLNKEVSRVLALPDIRERMLGQGAIPKPTSPEEFDTFIRAEVNKLRAVILASNQRVN